MSDTIEMVLCTRCGHGCYDHRSRDGEVLCLTCVATEADEALAGAQDLIAHQRQRIEELEGALQEVVDYSGGAENVLEDEYVMERAHAALTPSPAPQPDPRDERILELEGALREIVDYQPEPILWDGSGECEECDRAMQRRWPPSLMCNRHYGERAKAEDEDARRRANQHFEMRRIAREALDSALTPSPSEPPAPTPEEARAYLEENGVDVEAFMGRVWQTVREARAADPEPPAEQRGDTIQDDDAMPRRTRLDRLTPAERAIDAAMRAIEDLPADTRLTHAVVLLGDAKTAVADYVDGVEPAEQRGGELGQKNPWCCVPTRTGPCGRIKGHAGRHYPSQDQSEATAPQEPAADGCEIDHPTPKEAPDA